MISIQQTIDIIKNNQPDRKKVSLDLAEAHGYILADKIEAIMPFPHYNNSAMDGFAVFWKDIKELTEAKTFTLQIAGESRAGHPFEGSIKYGQAIRISTGAIVPDYLDCIIPVENCEVNDSSLKITQPTKQYQHIRYAGEDFTKGQELLYPGTEIKAAEIALLASQGMSNICVYQKARVSLLTTGSELVTIDKGKGEHQLFDSNSPMLFAAVNEAFGEVVQYNHLIDDAQETLNLLNDLAQDDQIIISTGGVSMGEHDHVRDMALKAGYQELFWKVNQKPGKPMFMAKKGTSLLFALPGNPVSAFMCFKHYVAPLLKSISGRDFDWPQSMGFLSEDVYNEGSRTQMMRIHLKDDEGVSKITAVKKQGSHMPTSIAHADGYIIVPAGAALKAETQLPVFLF